MVLLTIFRVDGRRRRSCSLVPSGTIVTLAIGRGSALTPYDPRQISSPGSDLYLGQRAQLDATPSQECHLLSHAFCFLIFSHFRFLSSSCESLFAPASSLVVKLYDSRGRRRMSVPASPDSAHKARLPKQSSAAVAFSSSSLRWASSPSQVSSVPARGSPFGGLAV